MKEFCLTVFHFLGQILSRRGASDEQWGVMWTAKYLECQICFVRAGWSAAERNDSELWVKDGDHTESGEE